MCFDGHSTSSGGNRVERLANDERLTEKNSKQPRPIEGLFCTFWEKGTQKRDKITKSCSKYMQIGDWHSSLYGKPPQGLSMEI